MSQTLVNYGVSGLKMPNNNMEIGVKHKGNACFFFVHRGSGRMTLSGKVPLKPDDKFHLLTVKIAGDAPEGDALSVSFAVDGKPVKSTEKNKGWLKHGKYPTMSAPIDIGGRVDGNKYEATIGAHMKADADMAFKGVISEVRTLVTSRTEMPFCFSSKSFFANFFLTALSSLVGDDLW